jgi:hypothetical protein
MVVQGVQLHRPHHLPGLRRRRLREVLAVRDGRLR